MVTSKARLVAGGAIGWLNSSVGGESTSTGERRGGGVGRDPGERVVVVMLLDSLGLFLDLPEGPTDPIPARLADPLPASRVSTLG